MAQPLRNWTPKEKFTRGVWAVGVFIIVSTGSLTGAWIKSDKQKEEAIQGFRQLNADEQIAMLESHRVELLKQKATIQRKIDTFKETVKERNAEEERRRNAVPKQ